MAERGVDSGDELAVKAVGREGERVAGAAGCEDRDCWG